MTDLPPDAVAPPAGSPATPVSVTAAATPAAPAAAPPAASAAPSAASEAARAPRADDALRRTWIALAVVAALGVSALLLSWFSQQRVRELEMELVRRQQDAGSQSAEARVLAKQASDTVRDNSAKVALLEARLAEVSLQRSQLEELIQSLSRSRDENMLVDIDSGLRVAMQQAAITGSGEPLVATLRQADERLQRSGQPRLEGVRRAIARDLDRVRAVATADVPSLSIKLDEAVRLVDEAPLLAVPEPKRPAPNGAATARPPARAASAAGWRDVWSARWQDAGERLWQEAKSLVRVTRIDYPESMLLAPDQAFFLRENLKLRLLNARLALLSRQFDTAQADLQLAQQFLERYFDRSSRRVTLATELLRQVAAQSRQVVVPRPDETLAALAAATAGR